MRNKIAYYNIRKKRLEGNAMARTKKTDILSEYERVRQPDADKLAELVERAKGKRTTTEFAEACGVNASTISRILNGVWPETVVPKMRKSVVYCIGGRYRSCKYEMCQVYPVVLFLLTQGKKINGESLPGDRG